MIHLQKELCYKGLEQGEVVILGILGGTSKRVPNSRNRSQMATGRAAAI